MVKIRRALLSVSDKTGLVQFAEELNSLGVEIISTGGTKKLLDKNSIPSISISKYTKTEEMLNGRVKTLHPEIHAGILAKRDSKTHMDELKREGIKLIDMAVVNLYPFNDIISKKNTKLNDAIENIDIGGPTLLRAAAKNYRYVAAVSNPSQYPEIIKELKENNCALSKKTLAGLSVEVFKGVSIYNRSIYHYLKNNINTIEKNKQRRKIDFSFSEEISVKFNKIQDLRYGENPHQKGAFYRDEKVTEPSLTQVEQLHGKELSFNNIMDLNSALQIVKDFNKPACCIIKHTNPCGIAEDKNLQEAYKKALDCDSLSAFGSIVGFNKVVNEETARLINKGFIECVLAPGYTQKALEILKKKKKIRILDLPNINIHGKDIDIKKITGGALIQENDTANVSIKELKVVTKNKPTKQQMNSLLFAWRVCKYVKSNAIVLAKNYQTVGIGAGQMSRVDAVLIAARKAGKNSEGSVMASDAFIPKEDGVEVAHNSGIKSIIQPGGSINDKNIIRLANKLNISMVFTGMRHFRH